MNEVQIDLLKNYILEDLEKTRKSDISAKEKAELEISALRALVELENSPVAARIDKAYEAFTTQQNEIDINKIFMIRLLNIAAKEKCQYQSLKNV